VEFRTAIVCSKCKQQLSLDKATVTCASKFLARRVTTSSTAGFRTGTVGTNFFEGESRTERL